MALQDSHTAHWSPGSPLTASSPGKTACKNQCAHCEIYRSTHRERSEALVIANRSLVALFESREEATMLATTGLGIRCLSGCNGCLGYGLLLGFFGVGAAIGAVVLQRARSKLSVEWV